MWQILNLTKTHGRATLNVPVISSESLDRIAKHGTTISRMKTKVNIGKLVELGGEKDSCRPRWKVGNSLRNKILAQVRHVSVKKKKKWKDLRVSKRTQKSSFQVTSTGGRLGKSQHLNTEALHLRSGFVWTPVSATPTINESTTKGALCLQTKPTPLRTKPISKSKRGALQLASRWRTDMSSQWLLRLH